MDSLRRLGRQLLARVRSMAPRARLVPVLLVATILAGVVWLVWPSSPKTAAVSRRGPKGAELAADRAIPAGGDVDEDNFTSSFEKLAGENDIWTTQARSDKRWQAAKMATLSRLISKFSSVSSATVIFEGGSPRRLGTPAVAPTAAVNVVLAEGKKLTRQQVGAIADMVAGSIAGMTRRNVRVIDSIGRSYRPDEHTPADGDAYLVRAEAAEAHYMEKICAALRYIDDVVVGLHVAADGQAARCVSVSVSVPRSYLAAAYRSVHNDRAEPSDRQIESFAAVRLGKIQQAVVRVIGGDDPSAVKVDWYYDVPAAARRAQSRSLAATLAGNKKALALLVVAAGVIVGGLIVLGRRSRKHSAGGVAASNVPATAEESVDSPSGSGVTDSPWELLRAARSEDILAFVGGERSQAIAVILAHLSAPKAAAVLAGLGRVVQVDVTRRIANLQEITPEVLGDIEQSLAARLGRSVGGAAPPLGGVDTIAEILRHAGYATERHVLESFGDEEPALAESISKRMFVFEDIVHVPAERLRPALETLGSDELAVALRTAGDDLKRKVYSSLCETAAADVRRQTERIGPVRLSDVEAAQQRVVDAVRSLCEGVFVSAAGTKREIIA